MQSSLISFGRELSDLRHYIETLELEAQVIADVTNLPSAGSLEQLRNHIVGSSGKRRFDYNSIIISLYGSLEQFVESLVRNYISYLNEIIPRYNSLPETIINNHIDLAFGLISRASQSRYRGAVEASQIVSNLHSCLSDSDQYQINTEAFVHHTANFRADVIDQTFNRAGVSEVSRRIRVNPVFQAYLAKRYSERAEENINTIKNEEIFFYLNDLAERRNDVSHGTPSDLLSNELLLSYFDFFDVYGPALHEVVRSSAFPYEVEHRGIELGTPIVVHDHSIVCLSIENKSAKVGDLLIAKTGNSACPYLGGEIQEIQVRGIGHQEIVAEGNLDVALRVDYKTKDNHSFVLVPTMTAPPLKRQ